MDLKFVRVIPPMLSATIVLLIASAPACMATTWYVSTSGSDSNPGTSSQPFATPAHAVSVVTAGDTVDIDGGTYHLTGSPVTIDVNGTTTSPITIQSTPGESAVLDGSGITSGSEDTILVAANDIVVKNLTVQNSNYNDVLIWAGNNDSIENCTLTGAWASGAEVGEYGDSYEMQGAQVLDCTIHDNAQFNFGQTTTPADNAAGIGFTNCQYCHFHDNVVYHNWSDGILCMPSVDTSTFPPINNDYVSNNTVYDNYGHEMELSNAQYLYVEGNLVYCDSNAPPSWGNPPVGIQMENHYPGPTMSDCQILNNIVIGGETCIMMASSEETWSYAGGYKGSWICNNVFYAGSFASVDIDYDTDNTFVYANNIAWQPDDSAMIAQYGANNPATVMNNCWDGKGTNQMLHGDDTILPNVDPGFVNAGALTASSWALLPTSPCADSGMNLSSVFTSDLAGTARPSLGPWTMGAFAEPPHMRFDFNESGEDDLLFQNSSTGQIVVWYMDGTTRSGSSSIFATAPPVWQPRGVADINADGHPDMLWWNSKTGSMLFWELTGAQGTTQLHDGSVFATEPTVWQPVSMNDFNRDGHPDILFENMSTGQLEVWYMDGNAIVSNSGVFATVPTGWRIAGTADFDGQGHPDLLLQNSSSGQLVVWYLDGTGGTTLRKVGAVFATLPKGWNVVSTGDTNGDGLADLTIQNPTTGQIAVWLMTGTLGTTTKTTGGTINAALGWEIVGVH